ncbi:MAG: hypothetical protein ACRCTE_06120 [Cellulosilyticaceae bacterium]
MKFYLLYSVVVLVSPFLYQDIVKGLLVLIGIYLVLLLIQYNGLTSGYQNRSNFYMDKYLNEIDSTPKAPRSIMPIKRFGLLSVPIVISIGIQYIVINI